MEISAVTSSLAEMRARLPELTLRDRRRLGRRLEQAAARRDTGAAGRQYQRMAVDVTPLAQPLLDLCPLVGDDLTGRDLTADRAREFLEAVAAVVGTATGGPRRADREDGYAHQ